MVPLSSFFLLTAIFDEPQNQPIPRILNQIFPVHQDG
jgi:hypothetical protein